MIVLVALAIAAVLLATTSMGLGWSTRRAIRGRQGAFEIEMCGRLNAMDGCVEGLSATYREMSRAHELAQIGLTDEVQSLADVTVEVTAEITQLRALVDSAGHTVVLIRTEIDRRSAALRRDLEAAATELASQVERDQRATAKFQSSTLAEVSELLDRQAEMLRADIVAAFADARV